jgi:cytochrome c peroxidase
MFKWTVILLFLTLLFLSFSSKESDDTLIKTKAQLGKKLFNDKILSLDSTVSCASCHKPQFAFADTVAFSTGIKGKPTKRNTPSVLNMLNRTAFFWDGRAATLEQQALMPIENPDEMGLPIAEAIKRLNENKEYKKIFLSIFKQKPNQKNLAEALAAFEKTLETMDSKFDDWTNDIRKKWTASEERGRALFTGEKAKCFNCHMAEDFTNDDYKSIGTYDGVNHTDEGRYGITKSKPDIGKFKTPGLRNVAATAPYMHNGMFATLEEVVEYYDNPTNIIKEAKNLDTDLQKPLGLTPQEKKDLVAFLKTLTDRKYTNR